MATAVARGVDAAPIDAEAGARSAVLWAPVLAGATVAIAITLVLIALGSGLGFAAASPWPGQAPSATTFAIGVGVWLIVTQWLSALLGGYVTGRLRTRWTSVHTKEVLFRDTAHGLLAWAVASIIVAVVAFGGTTSAITGAASAATAGIDSASDALLRPNDPSRAPATGAVRSEAVRLLGAQGGIQAGDRSYLVDVVAAQAGVPRDEAQRRVDTAVTSIKQAADKARKTSSAISLFTALAMLVGAFIASAAAAYGGELRDKEEDRLRLS